MKPRAPGLLGRLAVLLQLWAGAQSRLAAPAGARAPEAATQLPRRPAASALPRANFAQTLAGARAPGAPGTAALLVAGRRGSRRNVTAASEDQLFLMRAAESCRCTFKDVCGCHSSMAFMTCIKDACASGVCDCHDFQFLHACVSIAKVCDDQDISCSEDRALCLREENVRDLPPTDRVPHAGNSSAARAPKAEEVKSDSPSVKELYSQLRDLKEKSCWLQREVRKGKPKSPERLESVEAEIAECMEELADRGEKLPEMHCQKHFEEWHLSGTRRPRSQAPTRRLAVPAALAALIVLSSAGVVL